MGDERPDYVALYLHPWDSPRNEVNKFGRRTPDIVRGELARTWQRVISGERESTFGEDGERGAGRHPSWVSSGF